jgi:cytidine deaminase
VSPSKGSNVAVGALWLNMAGKTNSSSRCRCENMHQNRPAVSEDVSWHELFRAALQARSLAYAPYSQFCVGAAIECEDGTIHSGANVENASYGLTICAERVAMSLAIMAGQRSFKRLAVASPGGVAPCGACRQFLAEFSADALVGMCDASGSPNEPRIVPLAELLPYQFSGQVLTRERAHGEPTSGRMSDTS